MVRTVGSPNREKPVRDLLRLAALSSGGRRLRVIVEQLLCKAEAGDLQAIKEVMDRLDGRPAQAQVHSDADGGPLRVILRQVADVIGAAPPMLIEHADGGDET